MRELGLIRGLVATIRRTTACAAVGLGVEAVGGGEEHCSGQGRTDQFHLCTKVIGIFRLARTTSPRAQTFLVGISDPLGSVADDDLVRLLEPLAIREWVNDGIRGVQITSVVPRGFQQRIEYTETGLEGPWQILTVLLGQEGETLAFDSYEESFGMRMYRAVPFDPLELTLPW